MSLNTGNFLSSITTALSGYLGDILKNPATDLKFLVPVSILVIASLAIRSHSKRVRIDSVPTLSQKIEPFETPRDKFNVEVRFIVSGNYDVYVSRMDEELNRIEEIKKKYLILRRKYRNASRALNSLSERRKTRANETREATFHEIIKLAKELSADSIGPAVYSEVET